MKEREWTWLFTYLMEHQKLDPALAERLLKRILQCLAEKKERETNGN